MIETNDTPNKIKYSEIPLIDFYNNIESILSDDFKELPLLLSSCFPTETIRSLCQKHLLKEESAINLACTLIDIYIPKFIKVASKHNSDNHNSGKSRK